jgi:acetyl esterase
MPINSEFEPFLAMMKMAPPFADDTLEALRATPISPPSDVQVAAIETLAIEQGTHAIPVRLYRADTGPMQPLIVYFHGGGFVIGGLDSHDGFCRLLCRDIGCSVLAVDYRLAPEHKFPAASDDALAALRWAHANAGRLGVDASRIMIAGDSAGGNLTAATALRSRDEGGPALLGQVMFCPLVEFHRDDRPSMRENGPGPFLTLADIAFCTNAYLRSRDDAAHPHAAPLHAESLRDLPPALILTAEYDPLRDEGEAYAARLKAEGVDVRCTRYDGTIHDFMVMSEMPTAGQARGEACDWIRARFVG